MSGEWLEVKGGVHQWYIGVEFPNPRIKHRIQVGVGTLQPLRIRTNYRTGEKVLELIRDTEHTIDANPIGKGKVTAKVPDYLKTSLFIDTGMTFEAFERDRSSPLFPVNVVAVSPLCLLLLRGQLG